MGTPKCIENMPTRVLSGKYVNCENETQQKDSCDSCRRLKEPIVEFGQFILTVPKYQ